MTDPGHNPHPHNPFDTAASAPGPAGSAPAPTSPPPSGAGGEVNTPATLSVVFAFVFAPAGAILGHLGLSQIARTRQRGRDRALVGLTLSYVIITTAVVALVVWASMGHTDSRPATASPTTSAARLAPPRTPPPAPAVALADVAALLPNLQQTKDLTANQTLNEGPTARVMAASTIGVDRPDCIGAMSSGVASSYNQSLIRGFYESEFLNVSDAVTGMVVGLDVVAFDTAAGAQAQRDDLIAQWNRCITGPTGVHYPDGRTYTASFTPLTDAGDGITTMGIRLSNMFEGTVRAVAAKANVVVDMLLSANTADSEHTLAVMKFILAKIPG